jgi:hypothetical protein
VNWLKTSRSSLNRLSKINCGRWVSKSDISLFIKLSIQALTRRKLINKTSEFQVFITLTLWVSEPISQISTCTIFKRSILGEWLFDIGWLNDIVIQFIFQWPEGPTHTSPGKRE